MPCNILCYSLIIFFNISVNIVHKISKLWMWNIKCFISTEVKFKIAFKELIYYSLAENVFFINQ